jgi:hypothetical protein
MDPPLDCCAKVSSAEASDVCPSQVTLSNGRRVVRTGRFANSILFLFLIYAGSYTAFRQTNQDVWPKDETYVIFPSGLMGQTLYYIWRPLAYLDSAVTGIRFHVRAHQRRMPS